MAFSMCAGIFLVGWMIGSGELGNPDLLYRIPLAAACIFIALFGAACTVQTRKTHHIDISGIGQIRLGEYYGLADHSFRAGSPQLRDDAETVSLMDDSTLWPFLLLLRCRSGDGKIRTVPILPDSVTKQEFQALSVAVRWIAAQNDSAESGIF